MKVLRDENEYIYNDFMELQCGVCKKNMWDKGQDIISNARIQCPQCGTIYTFEPIRWRVLSEKPE